MQKAVGAKAQDGFLAALQTTTDALKMTQAGARREARRHAQFLEPPGREHARPGDRDDAEDAVRAARRDRHGFRRDLPDRRVAPAAHQGRRDAARRHPRLQHRLGRLFPRSRGPHDAGGDHPDAHAGRGDRRARIRHQAARFQGRHVRQRHVAQERRRRVVRRARHRQPVQLRPGMGEVRRSSRSRRPSTAAPAARGCATRRATSSTTTSATSRRPATRSPRASSSAA